MNLFKTTDLQSSAGKRWDVIRMTFQWSEAARSFCQGLNSSFSKQSIETKCSFWIFNRKTSWELMELWQEEPAVLVSPSCSSVHCCLFSQRLWNRGTCLVIQHVCKCCCSSPCCSLPLKCGGGGLPAVKQHPRPFTGASAGEARSAAPSSFCFCFPLRLNAQDNWY